MSSKRNIAILVSLLLWSGTAVSAAYRTGQVIRLSETRDSFESILDAVTAAGLTVTVEVDDEQTLQEDRIGPAKAIGRNITLLFGPGNVISLNGHVLEINGAIEAGPFQIFDCGDTTFEAVAKNTQKALVRGRPRMAGIYPQSCGPRDDASRTPVFLLSGDQSGQTLGCGVLPHHQCLGPVPDPKSVECHQDSGGPVRRTQWKESV